MLRNAILSLVVAATPVVALADYRAIVEEIQSKVEAERKIVGPYELAIDVQEPLVILSGSAASESARDRIGEIARTAHGVERVTNKITVDPSLSRQAVQVSASPGLADEVRTALKAHPGIANYSVSIVDVKDGVALRGVVGKEADREKLVAVARSVPGVTVVDNELKVAPPPPNTELIANVQSALAKEGLLTPADKIDAADGIVTVIGDRPSFRDVDRVLAVVNMVDGVRNVQSRMTVQGKAYSRMDG